MNQKINSNSPAMSEDVSGLLKDFAAAKDLFPAVIKDRKGNYGNYATIGSIYDAVEKILNKQNITIWHFKRPSFDTGVEYMYTRLIHRPTCQWLEDCRIVESEKPGNQGKGSADTYSKKYALLTLCALAAEDDDGQSEQDRIKAGFISKNQIKELNDLLDGCPNDDELYDAILIANKIKSLNDLKSSSFETIKTYIQTNKKQYIKQQ